MRPKEASVRESKRLDTHDYEYGQLEELKVAAAVIVAGILGACLVGGAVIWWLIKAIEEVSHGLG